MTSTDKPGLTIQEAKVELNDSFKTEFLEKVLPTFADEHHKKVGTIIDESIDQGVNEVYKDLYSKYQKRRRRRRRPIQFEHYRPYSEQGWAMFVLRDCQEAAERIYAKKIKEATPEMVAAAERRRRGEEAEGETRRRGDEDKLNFMGGRRKKHRKIKGKYTFKKRKSIRKKKRRTRKL